MKIEKIILLITIIFISSGLIASQEVNSNKRMNSNLISESGNMENDITLTNVPMDMYKVDENFEISWIPDQLECKFYYSSTPEGGEISSYTYSGITDTNIVANASEIGIGVGLYYCVIHNEQNDWTSVEFIIIIEPSNGVDMDSPESGSIINNSTPTFTWNTMPGVPYYHLVLSDQPFTIEYDEDDNLVVTGLNAIWQIITSETSAQYGINDPSGSFTNNSPPMIDGTEYNWIVLCNFNNEPVASSDIVSTPCDFTYETENTLSPPTLISPADSTDQDDDVITFQWGEVADAMTYQVFVSEIRTESGSVVLYPVWDQVTTNTLIDLYAASILINSDYSWKVVATDEDGVSSCSEPYEFHYDITIGTFQFFIGSPNGYGLGYSSIEIDPVEGSGDNIPLIVGPSGYEYKILPIGDYLITASKDGYETKDTLVTLLEDPFPEEGNNEGDTFVPIYLDYSPSYFWGSVVDSNGDLVENVEITAEESEGETRSKTSSDGNYSISVAPGIWTLSADKEGYTFNSPIQEEIDPGENIYLPDLVLNLNEKDLFGNVVNTNGVLLSSVTVTAEKGEITRTKTTNSSGHYEFIGLDLGEWEISAQKTGYYSPDPTTVEITATSPSPINLSNIVLTPQANIVSGNTNNSVVGLDGVTITATPSSGSPISTISDNYGNYSLNLPQGNYEFTAFLENYTTQNTHQINLSVGETIDGIDFTLLPNESFIEGTATSGGSGIEGVTISAGQNSDLTDNLGNYSISVSPGTYQVTATKSGYTSSDPQTISIGAGQSIEEIDFSLSPNASVVSGTVQNSGNYIANAQIKGYKISSGASIQQTTTNQDGEYSLNLYPGSYIIWAEKSSFLCEDSLNITAGPGQTLPNNDIELTVNEAYISGTTQTQTGNVLRNVNIQVQEVNNPSNSYSSISGVYGNYNIVATPGVNYEITASKSGYSSDETSTSSPLELEETFTPSPPLSLAALPSIFSGKIKSHDINGNAYPLEQATIEAVKDTTTYQTTTASNGEFSLGVDHGEYEITNYKTGYFPETIEIQINPGVTVDTTIFLEENFSNLEGVITDASTGEPVEDVLITANLSSGGGGVTYSDEDGNYLLENILPGFYSTITASKDNYETYTLTNEDIPAGATITKNAQLVPLTSNFEAQVYDINSNPLNHATVSAENIITGNVISNVTNTSGMCQITGLSGNVEFNLSVSKTNYTAIDTTILMLPDTTVTSDFTVQLNNASITGLVMDDENIGLGNVAISAVSEEGYSGNTSSQPTGDFVIQNLNPNQDYVVTLQLSNYTDVSPDTIPLYQPVYDTTLQMIPNDRIIDGTVVDQEGNTLSNVNVTATSANSSGEANTNSSGQFTIEELAPYETYTISTNTYEQGWENTSTTLSIEDEPVNALPDNLVMSLHTSKFIGQITDEDSGDPIVSAQITIQNEEGNTFTSTSQPDGSYSVKYLYQGNYDFTVSKSSYETETISDVYIDHRSQTTQNISLTYTAPVTILGHLHDTDGRIIDSTRINLFNPDQSLSDSTNTDGYFIFEEVTPYTSTTIGTDLPSSKYDNPSLLLDVETANIDTLLTIDIHSAEVSGIITDSFLGTPLANAEVTLLFNDSGSFTEISSTVTSSEGSYEFTYLYEGEYKLVVNRNNYESNDILFSLSDFQSHVLDIQLERTVVNPPVAALSASPQTGVIPLEVTFTNNSTQGTYPIVSWEWDFDGDGQIDTTGQGPYEYTFNDTSDHISSFTVSDGERFSTATKLISPVNQGDTIPPTANFSTSISTGYNPATITFTDNSTSGTNQIIDWQWDFNGDGVIDSSGQGPYEYTFVDTGNFLTTLTVSDGDLTNTSDQNITINLGLISGEIRHDSINLKNAIVTILDEEDNICGTDTTNSTGAFSLQNFSSDHSYSLHCDKTGYQDYIHPNILSPDSTDVVVNLDMKPNAILGTVEHEDAIVENATVKIKDQPGNVSTTLTNEFGDFEFTNVSPEYYDFWALSPDTSMVSTSQSVNISAGQSAAVNIELEIASHIVGAITHNNLGKPGVSIHASNVVNGRIFSENTNASGDYDIPLPHGTYDIDVILDGFTVNEPMPQVQLLPEEIITLNFTLTGINNTISGSAIDSETSDGIGGVKIVLTGLSSTGIPIADSLYTEASGSFSFQNLYDGNYTISASHDAYQQVEPINVTLSGGTSSPPSVDFLLEPKDWIIYGAVEDSITSFPLSDAVVYCSGFYGDFSDTTTSDGSYSIEVDTTGFYTLLATKFDYFPKSIEIELTFEQSTSQLNFILNPIPHYASIIGDVTIFDTDMNQFLAPDSANITLTNDDGDVLTNNIIAPDSSYEFNDLLIPDVFTIECFAYYLDELYQTQISDFSIEEDGTYTQDFNFEYTPEAVSLNGLITMNNNRKSSEPLANAEIVLTNNSGSFVDTTQTNQTGFYQFNNLLEDQYSLYITAEYDNEIFTTEIPDLNWTGEDITIDYEFEYILCSIEFHITEDGSVPIQGVNVQVQESDKNSFLLITDLTDENGFCKTDSILHTGTYSIKITKPYQKFRNSGKSRNIVDYINPKPYQLTLDSLSHYVQEKQLPLKFDRSQIEPNPGSENFQVSLKKSLSYTDSVTFHYYDVNDNSLENVMDVSNDTSLVATIPTQNQSGEVEFWFTSSSEANGLNYSNQSNTYLWQITSEGILSQENSTISPNEATLTYRQENIFEIEVYDDMNNSLNSELEESGTVNWGLTDSTIGDLEPIPDEKRLVKLSTPDSVMGTISGKLRAQVSLNEVTINLTTDFIYVRDMHLNKIIISGVEEVNNNESYFFSVNAISDSGWSMTVPIEWDSIPEYIGEVQIQNSGINYFPNTNYLGKLSLIAHATDPNYGYTIEGTKSINVFERINPSNTADTLFSGYDCNVILPDSMLIAETAKLFLSPVIAAPMKKVSTSNELYSNIFYINSNRSPNIFNHMPGLQFILENNQDFSNCYIAYWDNDELKWKSVTENSPLGENIEFYLQNIPDWHEYGIVGSSKPLGIYNLKLLPNPFTPYDQIGDNMGIQIIFEVSSDISRYPSVTAKIYNVNGTLVRTISENRPLLKGEYKAGERHTLHWDGKTDDGRMARNGRYVIQLIVKDAKNRDEMVKTIVLIK